MTARVRLVTASLLGVLVISASTVLLAAPAQAAKPSTDLSIQLTNKPDAKPGQKITYNVVIRNKGAHAAKRVQIDFRTSTRLKKVVYRISSGQCHRHPYQIVCMFGTVRAGKVATVAITGVMNKKLKKGDWVTNRVTLSSATKLINKADDLATDTYRIGIPRVAPAVPVPSPSGANKIQEFNSAAAKVFGLGRTAVTVTWVVLAAAIAWFILGLTLRRRSRIRRGITNEDP